MITGYAGVDSRLDDQGISHAWRLIVQRPDTGRSVQFIGPLPFDLRWLSVPRDTVYGDLIGLPGTPIETRGEEIRDRLAALDIDRIMVPARRAAEALFNAMEKSGIVIHELRAAEDLILETKPVSRSGIAGTAGMEIEAITRLTESESAA